MTKLMLVGDVHFQDSNLSVISEAWERLISRAKDEDVDMILQAGDMFEHANVWGKNATIGTIYSAVMSPFKESPIPLVMIPGNHDIAGPNDKDALAPLEQRSWSKVIRKPGVYPLVEGESGGIAVAVVPWVSRSILLARHMASGMKPKEAKKKIEESIGKIIPYLKDKVKEAQNKGYFVIFLAHIEVTGATRGKGCPQAGGSFEVTPVTLADLGADAYALGHIHKRQHVPGLPRENDGYIGTVCQLSFGEEDYEVGARLIELDDEWNLAYDLWVNNPASPRYYTVEALDDVDYRSGIDRIKVRSDKRPDNLPPGVIFEPKPKRRTKAQDDEEEHLDVNAPMADLLDKWRQKTECELSKEDLTRGLEGLKSAQGMASVGSLDRINKIVLRNITCLKNAVIDLSEVEGVVAVEGLNGSGKTSFIEAAPTAWYGESPSRSLSDLISNFAEDESLVEVDFSCGGENYTARRELKGGKRLSHQAYLLKGQKAIAGPKVREVTEKCSALIGNNKMVSAGVFSAQGNMSSLADVLPAERKELFAKLLGSDKFIEMSREANSLATAERARAEAHCLRAEELEGELEAEEEARDRLGSLLKNRKNTDKQAQRKEKLLDDSKTELESLQRANEARTSALVKIEATKAQMGEVWASKKDLETRREEAKANKASKNALEQELSKAKEARAKLEEIRDEHSEMKDKKAALLAEASQKKAEASTLRERRLKALSEESSKALVKGGAVRKNRAETQVKIDKKLGDLKDELATARAELATMKEKSSLLEGFPDEAACRDCPLASDGIKARDGVKAKEEEVSELIQRAENGEIKKALFEEKTEQLVKEASSVDEDSFQTEELEKALRFEEEVARLEERADELTIRPDVMEEARRLRDIVRSIPDMEERIEEARNAEAEAERLELKISSAEERASALDEEIKELEASLPGEHDCSEEEARVKTLKSEVDSLRDRMTWLATEIGKQEAKMEAYEKARDGLEKARKNAEESIGQADVMSSLHKALGRDGIPQMLVEQTLPRFEDIMNEMLQEVEESWSIQVLSKKETQDGSLREAIIIQVHDGISEREISTYSGGEKALLRYVSRIAFAVLQAERSGGGLKVLALDEALDAMDDQRATRFVDMLQKLAKFFNQVFVISHHARILSSIPMKIVFDKKPGHDVVVTVLAAKT